jgi:hypothetical protein
VGGGFPLRSNIPRSALCATLDTYNFYYCNFRVYLVTGPIEGRKLRHAVKKINQKCDFNVHHG